MLTKVKLPLPGSPTPLSVDADVPVASRLATRLRARRGERLCRKGAAVPRAGSLRLLSLLAMLGIAVVVCGCAGADVIPSELKITERSPGVGNVVTGTVGMQGPQSGEKTFEILSQTISGRNSAYFTVVKTCAGKNYTVKAGEAPATCVFEVNAVNGMFTALLTASLETTWRFTGGSNEVITTRLKME